MILTLPLSTLFKQIQPSSWTLDSDVLFRFRVMIRLGKEYISQRKYFTNNNECITTILIINWPIKRGLTMELISKVIMLMGSEMIGSWETRSPGPPWDKPCPGMYLAIMAWGVRKSSGPRILMRLDFLKGVYKSWKFFVAPFALLIFALYHMLDFLFHSY